MSDKRQEIWVSLPLRSREEKQRARRQLEEAARQQELDPDTSEQIGKHELAHAISDDKPGMMVLKTDGNIPPRNLEAGYVPLGKRTVEEIINIAKAPDNPGGGDLEVVKVVDNLNLLTKIKAILKRVEVRTEDGGSADAYQRKHKVK